MSENKLSRNELIQLGYKIMTFKGTEEELMVLQELFNKNVPHPNGANLFFFPEKYNSKKHNLASYNPSVEEVIDIALNYKPLSM
jgi:hypothetical protein